MKNIFLYPMLLVALLLCLSACVPESEETVDPPADDTSTGSIVSNSNVTVTKNVEQLEEIDKSKLPDEFLQGQDGNPAHVSVLYIGESTVVFSTQWNVLVAKANGSDWDFSIFRCWEYSESGDHGYLMRGDGRVLAIMCFDDILLLGWESENIDAIDGNKMLHPLAWDGNDLYIGYDTPRYTALYVYHSDTGIIEEVPVDDEKYKDIVNHEYKGDRLYYSKEEHQKAIEDILMAK